MSGKKRFFQTSKDVIKVIKSGTQLLILIFLLYLIVNAMTNTAIYKPYAAQELNVDKGFIAISYTGVSRSGAALSVSTDNLDAQLKALYDSGYVSVSQQDVIDYYAGRKNLPEKSLMLIFEDGKRETYIFAQKIMEAYNFKANMLTFANSFAQKNGELLSGEDLLNLEKNGFWELGSSGFRFHYINVFDKDGNYLGEMDELQFSRIRKNIDNQYDYYLMDYVRNGMGIPKESYEEMATRVEGDYQKLVDVYWREIDKIPALYALVTPNSGAFGHNSKVSALNEKWIHTLFAMNFNRLGLSINNRDSSIYDLSRTQPQSYWHTNHLLMRVWSDTGQELAFVTGDTERAAAWETICGQAEFVDDEIILTTLPDADCLLRLSEGQYDNFTLSAQLNGNKYGAQAVWLRMDESWHNGITITIRNNVLYIQEATDGQQNLLHTLDLNILDGLEPMDSEPSIDERGSRNLELTLDGNRLTVHIDGKVAAENIVVAKQAGGSIGLYAETSARITDMRKPVDNIYDGVFKGLVILENDGETVLFDTRLRGQEVVVHRVQRTWKTITDWFIENL